MVRNLLNFFLFFIFLSFLFVANILSENIYLNCHQDSNKLNLEGYKEQCYISGAYQYHQVWKSAGYAWCVTQDGIIIPHTTKKAKRITEEYCASIQNKLTWYQTLVVKVGRIINSLALG